MPNHKKDEQEVLTTEAMTLQSSMPDTSMSVARPPEVVLAEAKRAAQALADVIGAKKRKVVLNGEVFLEYEDWLTVGRFYGVTVEVKNTEFVDFGDKGTGFKAHAVALANGQVISGADAMCLDSEINWAHKPLFQICSMAQTRSCAKALRNVLAWVVVLAGFKPTPAEELDGVSSKPPIQQPQRQSAQVAKPVVVAFADEPGTDSLTLKSNTISEAQQRKLWAQARSKGWSEVELKELVARHGYEHSKDILKTGFDAILADLDKRGEF